MARTLSCVRRLQQEEHGNAVLPQGQMPVPQAPGMPGRRPPHRRGPGPEPIALRGSPPPMAGNSVRQPAGPFFRVPSGTAISSSPVKFCPSRGNKPRLAASIVSSARPPLWTPVFALLPRSRRSTAPSHGLTQASAGKLRTGTPGRRGRYPPARGETHETTPETLGGRGGGPCAADEARAPCPALVRGWCSISAPRLPRPRAAPRQRNQKRLELINDGGRRA